MSERNREDHSVGQDSFLDTTANLVGILIILVVIVGAKTKIDAEEYGRKQTESDLMAGLEQPRAEAAATLEALENLQRDRQQYALETTYRKRERDQLLTHVSMAREHLEEATSELDEQKRIEFEKRQELEQVKEDLSEVERQVGAAEETERPEIVLEHLPTPMARTVFNKELHIQLRKGRITIIPWDRLIQALRDQVPLAIQRKSTGQDFEDTLGPIGGYIMRYRMKRVTGGFELDRFELEETPTITTESLPEALQLGGRLRLELSSRNAAETVVTVWVYPDSFAEFRALKAELFDRGFLSAARPLPAGMPIGASPQGTRSSAQ